MYISQLVSQISVECTMSPCHFVICEATDCFLLTSMLWLSFNEVLAELCHVFSLPSLLEGLWVIPINMAQTLKKTPGKYMEELPCIYHGALQIATFMEWLAGSPSTFTMV